MNTLASLRREVGVSYLGAISSSAKIVKNEKVLGIKTYCLYLMPSDFSGRNVCPSASVECRLGCLNLSGRNKMAKSRNTIQDARYKKTNFFFEHNEKFMELLVLELHAAKREAEKSGYEFAVRLNGTSDIDWTKQYHNGQTVFEIFPNVQFYDYTKVANRFTNVPANYHLTFSHTGTHSNVQKCKELLAQGHNIAVVFNIAKGNDLPLNLWGGKVIDADVTDYRPADGNGVIAGLRWKNIADKAINDRIKQSCFVIQ